MIRVGLPASANHGVADSDSQAPSERPIPQEERAAKALVSALTGASTSTAGEDEEQDAEREEDGDDAPGGR